MVTVQLGKGQGRMMKAGGPWIYDNEIAKVDGDYENGQIVAVEDFDGYPLGSGFINDASKLMVRMMSRNPEQAIDDAFLRERVKTAWEYRKKTVDTSSCRIIFGEADFLPGLVIDKYESVLVVQSLALGIDRLKNTIVKHLTEILKEDGITITGVYERSDAKVRKKEGMELFSGFLSEPFDTNVPIVENGIRYIVDVANGQKTGFFLDQKYNRLAIQGLCNNAEVLDCFTHTGSFGLNAAKGGAKHVISVDASELAIEQAKENARLNGYADIIQYEVADVFEYLPQLEREKRQFDVVILDPPAFTKSRNSVKNATKGYHDINLRGMKLVKDGGFLATCSCSHFMEPELFISTIQKAAYQAHKRLRLVEFRMQSPDHPILFHAEESGYLKFVIFQVCDGK